MNKEEAMKILKDFHDKSALFSVRTALETLHPELAESEDERIRKEIIYHIKNCDDTIDEETEKRMLAWLENIPYTIDHEKREGFHLGYKAALEKQGESSDKIHYWTEEEIEPIISDYLRGAEHYGGMIGRLRCLKPKSLEKQGEKSLTVDIDSMIEAYEQRLLSQGNTVKNSPIINMCVAAFKHGVENTLDELHLKQGETSQILSNSSNIGKIEQKPAWSEEDEKMCQETIDWFEKKCFPYALESENPARESIKWLKSLKQRCT